jgi:hypothetical protein
MRPAAAVGLSVCTVTLATDRSGAETKVCTWLASTPSLSGPTAVGTTQATVNVVWPEVAPRTANPVLTVTVSPPVNGASGSRLTPPRSA